MVCDAGSAIRKTYVPAGSVAPGTCTAPLKVRKVRLLAVPPCARTGVEAVASSAAMIAVAATEVLRVMVFLLLGGSKRVHLVCPCARECCTHRSSEPDGSPFSTSMTVSKAACPPALAASAGLHYVTHYCPGIPRVVCALGFPFKPASGPSVR